MDWCAFPRKFHAGSFRAARAALVKAAEGRHTDLFAVLDAEFPVPPLGGASAQDRASGRFDGISEGYAMEVTHAMEAKDDALAALLEQLTSAGRWPPPKAERACCVGSCAVS